MGGPGQTRAEGAQGRVGSCGQGQVSYVSQLPSSIFSGLGTQWAGGAGPGTCPGHVRAPVPGCLGAPAVTGEGGDPESGRLPRRWRRGGFMRMGSEPEWTKMSPQAILSKLQVICAQL